MSGNAALGKEMLREWYNAAKQYPTNFSMPFDDLVSYLQELTRGTFLDNFGDTVNAASRNVGLDVIRRNMRELAAASQGLVETYPDGTPRTRYWFDSVLEVSQASLTNLDFVKKVVPEVAKETAKEVTTLAAGGLAIYVLAAGAAVGLAIYLSSRRATT